MKLFQILRIYRAFRGYELKELAEEIGISSRELSSIERGKQLASGAATVAILRWLLTEEKPLPETKHNGRRAKPKSTVETGVRVPPPDMERTLELRKRDSED